VGLLPPGAALSAGRTALSSATLAVSAVDAAAAIDPDSLLGKLATFQQSHTLLQGVLLALLTRYLINEVRRAIEKPVMDELGNRVRETVTRELKPDMEAIGLSAWAKLVLCVLLDLAGDDASEALPILGEFTDVGFAPSRRERSSCSSSPT